MFQLLTLMLPRKEHLGLRSSWAAHHNIRQSLKTVNSNLKSRYKREVTCGRERKGAFTFEIVLCVFYPLGVPFLYA